MTILFGTTLRPECRPLAEVAAYLAGRMQVPLRLVHVVEDLPPGITENAPVGIRASLDEEARRLHLLAGIKVETHLASGLLVDTLVSIAEFELAEALLIGAGSEMSLLGGTAERAARICPVPVLALREPSALLAWLREERPLRILVGADFGRAAEAARAFAARLQQLIPCEIEVVHVVSPGEAHAQLGLPAPISHDLAKEAEAAILRELARRAPPEEKHARLRVLPTYESADLHLTHLAQQGAFDLILVGQRRQSVLEQLWYSSVARGVLRTAPVSVVCVPPTLGAPKLTFRRPEVIVVGTDLSEVGDAAITQAMGLASQNEGTVHLVHVLSLPSSSAEEIRDAKDRAWYTLSKLSVGNEGDEDGPSPVKLQRHLLEGEPAAQILALAERVGADLIVLGAPRRPVLSLLLLGSVTRDVAQATHVPILLVPDPMVAS